MIYLDSAATTLQKPPGVASAVLGAMERMASPGRGGYSAAMEAAELVFSCRRMAAELFDVPDPANVVFTANATHGLNIAIHTLVKPGSTVLISGYEHNAVTRPLHMIPGVTIKTATAAPFDRIGMMTAFQEKLTAEVSAVIVTHVSNVFGFVLPIQAISQLCQFRQVPLIVDASQSAGCLPVSMKQLGADFIAMSGHKGLYGPQGTGLLLCGCQPDSILAGGTGSDSAIQTMPDYLPDRVEAGTHNVPGIAGLLEGLRFVRNTGTERIRAHEVDLIRKTALALMELPGIRVFQSCDPSAQTGVLSFQSKGKDCEEVGEWLGQRGIAVRAGLHCAPVAHESAGTLEKGTVRVSVSAFSTQKHVELFVDEMKKLSF